MFALLAVIVAVAVYFGLRNTVGSGEIGWICVLAAFPFALGGFFTYNGMTLERFTETLQSAARKHLYQLATLNWQQADGLTTALPLGLRRIDALRTLTTEALAVLMPFKAQEIRDQGGAVCQ